MTTVHSDRLVEDYLRRLEAAAIAAGLPPDRRAELVAEIREHVREALPDDDSDETAVRNVLERLGPPEDIAADAAEAGPAPRRGGWNGLAIASFVCGLLWIWWLGSVLALAFGYRARRQIMESGGGQQGAGLATAGIVLGWVAVAIGIALVFGGALTVVGGSAPSRPVPVPTP
jgi:uncharacterized membrane protein